VQDWSRRPSRTYRLASARTGRVNVAIAITEGARGRIHEIAAACRALGLRHTVTLTGVGVLIGSVGLGDLRRLWGVPEVIAIEVERKLRARMLRAYGG
jgi:hypothetical protein